MRMAIFYRNYSTFSTRRRLKLSMVRLIETLGFVAKIFSKLDCNASICLMSCTKYSDTTSLEKKRLQVETQPWFYSEPHRK